MVLYCGNLDKTYYISHHGILGMKWGVRRYQNKDGTLTAAGRERYGLEEVKELEKKAIKTEYKNRRKNGQGYVFRFARVSTGENFNKAQANFDKLVSSDKQYQELSRKAFDAEKNV